MKKKIGKIVLFIVCGLVVYAAISHFVNAWRAKQLVREIANLRRTLREQGFKTEFDDFKITTDPVMRARLAALTALGYEPKLNTNGDVLDFRPIITDGTCKVIWKQDSLILGTNDYQWAGLRAALDKEQVRLEAACDAVLAGPFQSDLDLNKNAGLWNGNIGHLARISRTFGYLVILNLHDGNPDVAWTNMLAATRLATAWNVEPAFISHIIRATMVNNNFALTWQALQFNHWPDDRLAALQNEWQSADLFTNLSEILGLERVQEFHYCQKLLPNPPTGTYPISKIAKDLLDDPSLAFREAGQNYQDRHYRGDKVLTDGKNLLLYFRDRELELRHAIQSPTWAQMRAQPGITNPPAFASPTGGMKVLVEGGSRIAFPLTAITGVAETERRILITAIALERYRGKYGAYPPILDPLTPEFLNTPLPDFMDGQPLRYRPTNDGHFILYSIGPDCVDDGGKPPPPDAPRFVTNQNGTYSALTNVDIVWPPPATQ